MRQNECKVKYIVRHFLSHGHYDFLVLICFVMFRFGGCQLLVRIHTQSTHKVAHSFD